MARIEQQGLITPVTLVTLCVVMVIGSIIGLMSFLSYLVGQPVRHVGDNSHEKIETRVEEVRREFQTPSRLIPTTPPEAVTPNT